MDVIYFLCFIGLIFFVAGLNTEIKKLRNEVNTLKTNFLATTTQPIKTISSDSQTSISTPVITHITKPVNKSLEVSSSPTEATFGRILGKVGVGAIIIGFAFFLQYAITNGWIGPIGQIMIGLLIGVSLIIGGQYIRAKYLQYSDILTATGIVILYLSIFSSYSFYQLVDQPIAFVAMVCITVFAFFLSISGSTISIATIAIAGGFVTPILIHGEINNSFALFLYILILSMAVTGISFYKHWIRVTYYGFIGSSLLFMMWGSSASLFERSSITTFIFLSLNFSLFLFSTIAHHIYRKEQTKGLDITLLSLNAFWFFGIVSIIWYQDFKFVFGFFALFLSIIYFCITIIAHRTHKEDTSLNLFLPFLSIIFVTIAIPIQFNFKAESVSIAWLIESIALFFISFKVHQRRYELFGLITYILGLMTIGATYKSSLYMYQSTITLETPFLNTHFFLLLLAIFVGYGIGYLYHKYGSSEENSPSKTSIKILLVFVQILILFTFTTEINYYFDKQISIISRENNRLYELSYKNPNSIKDQSNFVLQHSAIDTISNTKNTTISIFWVLYSSAMLGIGFYLKHKLFRSMGLILFFITAMKIFLEVWSLGELYRIISSIVFGAIALGMSFLYYRYKDQIKKIV
ncbi:MAG: DUF2339 domain-containing protein [Candidatus Roizmanbacteria bacterium]